jgi:sodium-dependent phosphate cotransporter
LFFLRSIRGGGDICCLLRMNDLENIQPPVETVVDPTTALKTSPEPENNPARQPILALWGNIDWRKVALFGVSLFLFILAIILMKEGAKSLVPLIQDRLSVTSPANSLGLGWLFAYAIMSGSPVAASALTFFDAGALSQLATFTMITGSRIGASLIVLLIGFVYILRGRDRVNSLSMGLLSLFVTGSTYLVALVIGIALLQSSALDAIQLSSGSLLASLIDLVFGPIVSFLKGFLPGWSLFPIGLFIILISFTLFDRCLPQMTLKESRVGQVSRFVYRPVVMFLLGAGVTMVSMSVSLSLSLLVPLSERGFIRRENVIPYIMGANITTFVDTLFASVLLNNPAAFTVVLVSMVSIGSVSLVILAAFLRPFERAMLSGTAWVAAEKRNLAFFLVLALVVPIILLVV